MQPISNTDLILNPDGSIYHLHLLPGEIADTVILVGDPGRVRQVSAHFDTLEVQKENREFVTHTGMCRGKRLSVISTGIGTDNIDIVINELDALVNLDLATRLPLQNRTSLDLIRIGTSGSLNQEVPAGAVILTAVAGGLDGLYHFYEDPDHIQVPGLSRAFSDFTQWKKELADPYFIAGSESLIKTLDDPDQVKGITLSTPGFYAPQARSLRLSPFDPELIQKLNSFNYNGLRICNFEMECSALYALSSLLGHRSATICVAIANRITSDFLEDYKGAVSNLIRTVIDKLTTNAIR